MLIVCGGESLFFEHFEVLLFLFKEIISKIGYLNALDDLQDYLAVPVTLD